VPQPQPAQNESVSQVAARILTALLDRDSNRSGSQGDSLERALEYARRLASRTDRHSTLETEQLEALTGAIESIERGRAHQTPGAVRLLEHLAQAG
jgi:hypothetical protein